MISTKCKEKIVELRKQGKKLREIAVICNVSIGYVGNICRLSGLTVERNMNIAPLEQPAKDLWPDVPFFIRIQDRGRSQKIACFRGD